MYPRQYLTYSIKENKHELLSKIRIIDDLLPNVNSASIRKDYDFDNLACNYNPIKIGEDGKFSDLQQTLINRCNKVLSSINYGEIKEMTTCVFLVSDNTSHFKESMHLDDTSYTPNGYTLSYHLMGDANCGGTSFYEDFHKTTPLLQVPFKENRLVIFPACIPHTGYTNHGYPNNSKRVIYTLFTVLFDV